MCTLSALSVKLPCFSMNVAGLEGNWMRRRKPDLDLGGGKRDRIFYGYENLVEGI